MNRIKLTATQERRLKDTLQHTHNVRQYRRSLAVLECARGKPVHEVAQSLRVTRQSIHNWVTRFRRAGRSGALVDRPHTGRSRRANDTVDACLRELMGLQPTQCGYHATHWTVPLLRDQLRQHLNQIFCEDTIRRVLHRLGYVWKRPRYVLAADMQREKSVEFGVCLAACHNAVARWPRMKPICCCFTLCEPCGRCEAYLQRCS